MGSNNQHDATAGYLRFHGQHVPAAARTTRLEEIGGYGRMFDPAREPVGAYRELVALGESMNEGAAPNTPDSDIPAGYTYLGQFIVHDITFMCPRLTAAGTVEVENARTAPLDLDSLYYRDETLTRCNQVVRRKDDKFDISYEAVDLPRSEDGTAILPDIRNDENVIIAQLHLLFMKFHNRVADWLREHDASKSPIFEEAQRLVLKHYHWIVVHDYLPRLVFSPIIWSVYRDLGVSEEALPAPREGEHPPPFGHQPFPKDHAGQIPIELAVAVFRFGHSMIRNDYQLNQEDGPISLFLDGERPNDLRGRRPIPEERRIEWHRFFPLNRSEQEQQELQHARPIDPNLNPSLRRLPPPSDADDQFGIPELEAETEEQKREHLEKLAIRNLLRAVSQRIPSGQEVTRQMGLPDELCVPENELRWSRLGDPRLEEAFAQHTPLWFYVVKEAEYFSRRGWPGADGEGEPAGNGRIRSRLGPVGGRILAEVLLGLLLRDERSYFNTDSDWRPKWGRIPGHFEMADLVGIVENGVRGWRTPA